MIFLTNLCILDIIYDLWLKQENEKLTIPASHLIPTDGRQDGEQFYLSLVNCAVTCA